MSIQTAIEGVIDLVGAVTGIRYAPDEPPDSVSVYPFVTAFPGPGTHEYTAGSATYERLTLFTIVVQLHVARRDLERDYRELIPYADSIPNAIMSDLTFGGTVQTFGIIETDGLVPLRWGETDTLGYEYRITDVKIRTSVT